MIPFRIRKISSIFLLALTAVLLSLPVHAKEQRVSPGINAPFIHPDFQEWVKRFERPGREVYDKRYEIVSAMDLKPGMTVADIGAGTGLFTRIFASSVGTEGKVYAVDISKTFVDNIMRIAHEEGLKNVEGIVNTPTDAMLPSNSIDVAFICDTYHHFEYPNSMMQSIYRALKPGGIVIVVDFERNKGMSSEWIMEHVRAGKGTVIKEIESDGFKFVEEKHILQENYFLKFIKSAVTPFPTADRGQISTK